MTRDTTLIQARVQRLELELDEATERAWKARLAVKEAKALAKVARKARKQARKALALAQSELEPAGDYPARDTGEKKKKEPGKRKIADSPERPRKVRRKREKPQPPAVVPLPAVVESASGSGGSAGPVAEAGSK